MLAWALISFRFFLMLPVLETRLLNFGLDHSDFLMMVLGATLIAGAGNLINDFFDRESDHRNGKNRPHIAENIFWPVYWGMNGIGLSLCAWSAWKAGLLNLTLMPIAAVFMLFRYSEQWKKQGWWGPWVIVFLCCLWIALPWLYEFKAMGILFQYYRSDSNSLHSTWLIYLVFCAAVTMSRELIKSCEDYAGDHQTSTHTVAVFHGPQLAWRTAAGLWLFVWLLNTLVACMQWYDSACLEAAYTSIVWLGASRILWKFLSPWKASAKISKQGRVQVQDGNQNAQSIQYTEKPWDGDYPLEPNKEPYRSLSREIKIYFAAGILSIWVFYMIFLYGPIVP
jgi:4-hydroxybenzoate polyprenyltransferase